jgi:trehalose synthase
VPTPKRTLRPSRQQCSFDGAAQAYARVAASHLGQYEPLIGIRATDRLLQKARRLTGLKVLHVNSTRTGGGVAEILTSLVPLMNELGIVSDWLVLEGEPDFFAFTKDIHNALQGAAIEITRERMAVHRSVALGNIRDAAELLYDIIVVHDPQPLPLVELRRGQVWIWCCHIDASAPDQAVWDYLAPTVNRYDAAVFSLPEYAQKLQVPQRFIMPAIDPFSSINREMSRSEAVQLLATHGIRRDRPLVVQAGRFDKWKDPEGVVEAFSLASKAADATLVLVGNTAVDDPEGIATFEEVLRLSNDRVIVLSVDDRLLVNALQRLAAVVLQKSIREGFGLTVSEAMWKRRAVIGGNVGGIRHQIVEGQSGFLVSDIEAAGAGMARLIGDPMLRQSMGRRAKERVRRYFLMTRLLEDWLDLMASLLLPRRERVTQEPVQSEWR